MLFKKLFLSLSLAASLVGSSFASAEAPSWKWGGRLGVDYGVAAVDSGDSDVSYGATLSSAELDVDVDFHNSIKFSLGTDFNLGGDKPVMVKSAFLTFEDLFSHTDLFIGNVPSPFVLTDSNSSKYLPHMERSLVTAFQSGLGLGFGLTHVQDTWALKFVVKGGGAKVAASDSYSFVARGTWAPLMHRDKLVHLGLSASYDLKQEGEVTDFKGSEISKRSRFTSRAKADLAGALDASGHINFGADLAGVMGAFTLEGEFVGSLVQGREKTDDQFFWGAHADLGWFITGQSREYKVKDGRFGKVDRKRVGDWGVWEVAARYSHLDLSTKAGETTTANVAQNITGTLNWYPTDALRMSAEWVQSLHNETGTLGMRVQTIF